MRGDQGLRLTDWFCGAGGATQGAHAVPGIEPIMAANHDQHINGARSDNHPENLELWVTSQPSGQRPEDLATYARALLRRYGTPAEREAYQRAKAH